MSEANEPTAKSPNAPMQDRMVKARTAKAAKRNGLVERLAALESQLTALGEQTKSAAAAFPPAVQVPRRTPRSLSLGSLGD